MRTSGRDLHEEEGIDEDEDREPEEDDEPEEEDEIETPAYREWKDNSHT